MNTIFVIIQLENMLIYYAAVLNTCVQCRFVDILNGAFRIL